MEDMRPTKTVPPRSGGRRPVRVAQLEAFVTAGYPSAVIEPNDDPSPHQLANRVWYINKLCRLRHLPVRAHARGGAIYLERK